jgi:integrase
MARPPLPIGTHGQIRLYRLAQRRWRARTKFRDHDGVVREVERTGTSRADAEQRLKLAVRDRGRATAAGEITGDTKVAALGTLWLAEINRAVAQGKRSPTTAHQYRYRFDRHVEGGLGQLRIRELTVSRLDRLVAEVQDRYGTAAAKTTRTVLSGMVGLAVRHDALDRNPVREVGRIESDQSAAKALTLDQARDLRSKIASSQRAKDWDLVDLTDFMLATGLRIGEASAVTWDALDLDARTVEVRGTVVRVKGAGLVLKWRTKSRSGFRTLELPRWMVESLKARQGRVTPNEWGVVFTAPLGGLRDPSNTQADLRVIFAAADYPWVTSHVYRKTVATLMDKAGLSARAAADQLGHAKVSMTQDNYFGRKVAKTGAAEVLEGIIAAPKKPRKDGGKGGA